VGGGGGAAWAPADEGRRLPRDEARGDSDPDASLSFCFAALPWRKENRKVPSGVDFPRPRTPGPTELKILQCFLVEDLGVCSTVSDCKLFGRASDHHAQWLRQKKNDGCKLTSRHGQAHRKFGLQNNGRGRI
jgi:hypothetical protein